MIPTNKLDWTDYSLRNAAIRNQRLQENAYKTLCRYRNENRKHHFSALSEDIQKFNKRAQIQSDMWINAKKAKGLVP